MTTGPYRPPVAGVQRLDGICRADHLPDLYVVVEERNELGPRVTPQPDHRAILRAPFLLQFVESGERGVGIGCGVDPRAAVTPIMAALAPTLDLRPDAAIPSLDELRRPDDRFFRRGRTGSHHDELPVGLHQLFWSRADNQAAMTLLGYRKPDDDENLDRQGNAPGSPLLEYVPEGSIHQVRTVPSFE